MTQPTPEQALNLLLEGNARYASRHATHPHESAAYRRELVKGQHPFAAILSCADSRVPPELLFDQGFGDLFIIRVAGNLIDDMILASLEYAVCQLHVPLIMVLGHSQCGAVTAAVTDQTLPDHLPLLVDAIRPAVEIARDMPGDLLTNAIHSNARLAAAQMVEQSSVIAKAVAGGNVQIQVACYDLDSGRVELLLS